MERLTISLDSESTAIVNQHLKLYHGSKADIIRRALHCLQEIEQLEQRTHMKTIRIYLDYLANMEHIIVDIALWKAIFNELKNASDEFYDEVFHIGQEHQKDFFDSGRKDIKTILEFIEKTNVFKLNIDSENSYTLILTVSEASKFLKTFFQGFFKNYPRDVEITEEYKKIRIRVI